MQHIWVYAVIQPLHYPAMQLPSYALPSYALYSPCITQLCGYPAMWLSRYEFIQDE